MPSPPKASKPKDNLPTVIVRGGLGSGGSSGFANTTFSGPYANYAAYYSVISGPGLTRATPSAGAKPRAATPIDTGIYPGEPVIPEIEYPPDLSGSPGTSEPPEEEQPSDDEEVLVTAVRSQSPASIPFDTYATAPGPRPKPSKRPAPRRRSTPAPKRTRPVRPRSPPAPGPRIPIPVPEIVVSATRSLLPILGVLSLIPPYMSILGRVDRYGTQHMFDRLFPPLPRRDDERKPSNRGRPRSADPNPVGDRIVADPLSDLPEVVVTSPRPRPFPAPAPLPGPSFSPTGAPNLGDVPINRGSPETARRPVAPPKPKPVGAPNVLPQPVANPFTDPVPFPAPAPRPRPGPSSPTPRPPEVISFPAPNAPGNPQLDPLPEPQPVPEEDPCAEQKSKKKKKRSDRAVCYKGTYIERAKGITKKRRVRVDCRTGKELSGTEIGNSSSRSPRAPKRPPGGWPKNLKDLLNPPPPKG